MSGRGKVGPHIDRRSMVNAKRDLLFAAVEAWAEAYEKEEREHPNAAEDDLLEAWADYKKAERRVRKD